MVWNRVFRTAIFASVIPLNLMSTPKRRIPKWAILLALLAVIVTVGCVLLNKPHKKAEDQKAQFVDANKLFNDFSANEQAANGTYINKVLEVTGTATEVTTNQDGQSVLLIGVDDPLGGIQCTMRDKGAAIATGSKVRVIGFCNGVTSVVLLSDCVLVL